MAEALERFVGERASNRREYCRLPQTLSDLTFHVDHIIAEKHGGPTTPENLALACVHCNLHKGTDLSGIDPVTGIMTRLFRPRRDNWSDHFRYEDARMVGLTEVGRVTIAVLALNHPDVVAARSTLIAEGLLPPQF